MQLRVGYELIYDCPQPTPMMLMLNIHHSRANDIVVPDVLTTNPSVPLNFYRDMFGNWCTRIVAPSGETRLTANAIVYDTGLVEPRAASDRQHAVEDLSEECLPFLLGSRYCETDRLSDTAWSLFGSSPKGALRVQAICDFVHHHITFGYENARSTKTAWDAYSERAGVCRDFAHLAISFCRCMNIPARYCTGYLGDVGVPPPYGPMDFAAWFEAYVDGHWHTFDPRNNVPRIGRILMARGRDATDVAISTAFGRNTLAGFKVWVDEIGRSARLLTADMRTLTVRHVTVYRYSEPVKLGEHRMMFRPRESHDLRLVRTRLDIRPYPTGLRWLHDVFDNSIAIATFRGPTVELRFDSTVTLEHIETALPDYALEIEGQTYPFNYSADDAPDLARALIRRYPGDEITRWASRFLSPSGSTDTRALLEAMTLGIRNEFTYVRRPEKGVQRPEDTLRLQSGSCRDFAVFMMEAVRSLGLAARFVSGYIFVPESAPTAMVTGGATHAWMQVYLPGAGWVDFDPTNSGMGNRNLIRVAVAWDHGQALPLWGSFIGAASSFLGMDVNVSVTEAPVLPRESTAAADAST